MIMKILKPKDIAEMLSISEATARVRMREMPGCVNIGTNRNEILRVPESGFQDWLSNRVVALRPCNGKLARRKHGKLRAV